MVTNIECWGEGIRERVDARLATAIEMAQSHHCPPKLKQALSYATFPGGSRIRSSLCVAVARACGDQNREVVNAVATSIELLHCASLVHDDLACFDDATLRRGRLALHRVFGEALAVLTGDGLVVLAFEQLGEAARNWSGPLAEIVLRLSRCVGSAEGMVAGQAWELESTADLRLYHACKTAAIFEAATVCGALAAGQEGEPWARLGSKLGQAFQAADDIADMSDNSTWLGKPTGRDSALGRPSVALKIGLDQTRPLVARLLEDAIDSVPSCADPMFRQWLQTAIVPAILQRTMHAQITVAEEVVQFDNAEGVR